MYISASESDTDSDSEINTRLLQLNRDIEEIYSSLDVSNEENKDTIIYQGLSYLNTNFHTLTDNIDSSIDYTVHICTYHINDSLQTPFLQYFLYKPFSTTKDVYCSFPHFQYESSSDLYMKAINTIDVLCKCHYKETRFDFKGYFVDHSNIYIFFDCSHMKLDSLKMTNSNDLWLVTIDEIINYNKVCDFSIDPNIVELFHQYDKLSYLTMNHGGHYDMPIIAYSACPVKKIDFISTFGIISEKGIFGNHLYFTDYHSAKTKYENDQYVGIIRCIVFLGRMKMVRNLPDDPMDQSTLSKKDSPLFNRITDYDSTWSQLYDSIFIGKVALDDTSIFTSGPLWTIKNDASQYCILSSHISKVLA